MNSLLHSKVAKACLHSVGGVSKVKESVIELRQPQVTVGRDISSTFVVDETTVSRNHFELKFVNDNWILWDKSSFGTYLNRHKIAKRAPIILKNNDVISFGAQEKKFQFMFHTTDGSSEPCTRAVIEPPTQAEIEPSTHAEIELRFDSSSGSESDCFIVEDPPLPLKKHKGNESDELPPTQSKDRESELDSSVEIMLSELLQNKKGKQETARVEKKRRLELQVEEDRLLAEYTARSYAEESGRREVQKRVYDVLEEELECSICNELLINAVVLNCTHMFCEWCLSQLKKTMTLCPICRQRIANPKPCRVNSVIDKMVALLPHEKQVQRMQILEERAAEIVGKKPSKK